MATFGGVYDTQNKEFPGAYIVTRAAARTSPTFGDRGVVAIALETDWGANGVQKVTLEDLQRDGLLLFGYEITNAKMIAFRELLREANTLYVYRLNGGGVKASSTVGKVTYTAKYAGTKGNSLKVIVENDLEAIGNYVVLTLVDGRIIDRQSVLNATDLVANSYIDFSGTGALAVTDLTAGASLTGGTNATVTSANHASFLEAIEAHDFNILAYAGIDEDIKTLYKAFTDRLVSEGVLFQTVLYNKAADDELIISVKNKAVEFEPGMVYFTASVMAGVGIEGSNTNKAYSGEYTVEAYSKSEIVRFARLGHLVYNVEGSIASILEDVNSLITFTDAKTSDYGKNQIVRVLQQRAKDIAEIFNTRYKGKISADDNGLASFWSDLVTKAKEMQAKKAIANYAAEDTVVKPGLTKDSVIVVDGIEPVMALQKLYGEIQSH